MTAPDLTLRVVMVSSDITDDIDAGLELNAEPTVILQGSMEAVKAAAKLFGEQVAITRAFAALPAVGVGVKPLEWHQTSTEPARWLGHQADVSNPDYVIHLTADSPDVFAWGLDGDGWHGFCDTLETAQTAAQADYEARILAALEPVTPAPDLGEAHDEQLGVWADELMADLVLNSLMDLVDHDYDTKVDARREIIAALKRANQAKVLQPAPDAPAIREADWQKQRRVAAMSRRHMTAPEDPHVAALCERYGYGAVMDAASRLWARKDSLGAFYIGGCIGLRSDADAAALLTEKPHDRA